MTVWLTEEPSLLFINFFIRTYIRRTRASSPPPDRMQITKDSSQEAIDKVEKEIREAMAEQNNNENDIPPSVKAKFENARANLKKGAGDQGSKATKTAQNANDTIKDELQPTNGQAGENADDAARKSDSVAKTWNLEQDEKKIDNEEQSKENHTDNGPETKEEGDAEAEAYEVNPDVLLNEEEKKAEEAFQPNRA